MIETRKDRGLAQELVASLISNVFGESAVILDFLQRALAALESGIVCEIDRAHPALADPLADLITTTQHLPILEGWEQCFSFWVPELWLCFRQICFGVSSAQKRVFMLYYYNTAYRSIPQLGY